MPRPSVSVVIPVYGVEQYIENCLRSIHAQSFQNFEIILVDDGCKDSSLLIAEKFLQTTDLNWHIFHQKNQGQGPARDYGIRQAIADYVICVDSDDTVAPNFLETLYAIAQRNNSDVAFCLAQMVDERAIGHFSQESGTTNMISRNEMLHRFLLRNLIPILPAMLMRRQMILERGICAPAGCRFSEDLYFMWLVFSTATRISYTTAPLYNYLHRENSTMTASSQIQILSGYQAFCGITQDPRFDRNFVESPLLLSRWVLGALNSTARICTYSDFLDVAGKMNYRQHMKILDSFPSGRVRVLSLLLRWFPAIYYQILKRK